MTCLFAVVLLLLRGGVDGQLQVDGEYCDSVGKAPSNLESYPFESSFLQIFTWMKARCAGYVSSVTFTTPPSQLTRLFYLATFTIKRFETAAYFEVDDYLAIDLFPSTTNSTQHNLQLPPEGLKVQVGSIFGVFYPKWDTPQNMSVIRYMSLTKPKPNDKVTPKPDSMYSCYVGFIGFDEVSQISHLRIDTDLILTYDDRIPALAVQITSEETTSDSTTSSTVAGPRLVGASSGESCGPAPQPLHAFVVRNSLQGTDGKSGDDIMFACNDGYELKPGSPSRVFCRNPGPKWSNLPVCVQSAVSRMLKAFDPNATCGEQPPQVEHASLITQSFNGPSQLGDEANYACDLGYEFAPDSSSRVYCERRLPRPMWSTLPICQPIKPKKSTRAVYCVIPVGNVPNGMMVNKTYHGVPQHGDRVTFRCRNGYELVPGIQVYGSDVVCEADGFWSVKPVCFPQKTRCYDIPHVDNGFIYKQTFTLGIYPSDGDEVTYLCHEGYHLKDDKSTIACNGAGSWSGDIECIPDEIVTTPAPTSRSSHCGPPPDFSDAKIVSQTWRQEDIVVGDYAIYECDLATRRTIGVTKAVCVAEGIWSVSFKCYPKHDGSYMSSMYSCGKVLHFNDAYEVSRSLTDHRHSNSRVGDYVIYRCKNGAPMRGQQTVFCLADGAWSVAFSCDDDNDDNDNDSDDIL